MGGPPRPADAGRGKIVPLRALTNLDACIVFKVVRRSAAVSHLVRLLLKVVRRSAAVSHEVRLLLLLGEEDSLAALANRRGAADYFEESLAALSSRPAEMPTGRLGRTGVRRTTLKTCRGAKEYIKHHE